MILGYGSIIRVFGGSINISSSCFNDNTYSEGHFPGIIFIDEDSNLMQSNNNYEINNTMDEKDDQLECNGIFEQASGICGQSASQCNGSCVIFNASSCDRILVSKTPSTNSTTSIYANCIFLSNHK